CLGFSLKLPDAQSLDEPRVATDKILKCLSKHPTAKFTSCLPQFPRWNWMEEATRVQIWVKPSLVLTIQRISALMSLRGGNWTDSSRDRFPLTHPQPTAQCCHQRSRSQTYDLRRYTM